MIKPAMIPPKIGAAQYNQWNSQNPEITAGQKVINYGQRHLRM